MRKEVLKAFLKMRKKRRLCGIRFGITLPEQLSCVDFKADISNQLTVAVLLAKTVDITGHTGTRVELLVERTSLGVLL